MDASEVLPEIIVAGPYLIRAWTIWGKALEALVAVSRNNSMDALLVSLEVISRTEPFRSGATRFNTLEWLLMTTHVLPISLSRERTNQVRFA
jgi:hypothetical protein